MTTFLTRKSDKPYLGRPPYKKPRIFRGFWNGQLLDVVGLGFHFLCLGEYVLQFIDLLLNLLFLHVGAFLDLAAGFKGERTAAVVGTLTGALASIGEELTTDATRAAYRAWLSALLRPALQDVGWSPSASEPDDTRALRGTLVATLGETA